MNHFAAKAVWNGIAWNGLFRAAEHGSFHTVQINGEPAPFATKAEAESAAQASLIAYMNGRYRRTGEKATLRLVAEKLFRPGKRPIPVEVRRARA